MHTSTHSLTVLHVHHLLCVPVDICDTAGSGRMRVCGGGGGGGGTGLEGGAIERGRGREED